jgi:sugar-specific transcriptional regulator TrmB
VRKIQEKIKELLNAYKKDWDLSENIISSLQNTLIDNINHLNLIKGKKEIIKTLIDLVSKTKAAIVLVTPHAIPEILQVISEFAYQRKVARYMLTSDWDINVYGDLINKMMQLRNIQFRDLKVPFNYYICFQDWEEMVIGIHSKSDYESFSILSGNNDIMKQFSESFHHYLKVSRPLIDVRRKMKLRKKLSKMKNQEKKDKLLERLGIDESDLF